MSAGSSMKRSFVSIVLCAVTVLASGAVMANPSRLDGSERHSPFMRVYGLTQPPYGFVRFCEASPKSCLARDAEEARVSATPERLSDLDEVNRIVNAAVKPMTDLEIYGVTEHWTIPSNRGDCEDYALLKRQILMGRGWPASALLMTVVRDERGEGHAVLTARTAQGDFILDNKVEDVRLWNRTTYAFVMRQSYLNPRVWVSLDPSDATSPAALAGVEQQR